MLPSGTHIFDSFFVVVLFSHFLSNVVLIVFQFLLLCIAVVGVCLVLFSVWLILSFCAWCIFPVHGMRVGSIYYLFLCVGMHTYMCTCIYYVYVCIFTYVRILRRTVYVGVHVHMDMPCKRGDSKVGAAIWNGKACCCGLFHFTEMNHTILWSLVPPTSPE